MPGMGHGDRPRRSTDSGGPGAADGKPGKKRQPGLRDVWPQLRELVLPRRKILAVGFLLIAAIFQLADGAQVIGAALLRGLQDTRVPMLYAAFGYWIVGLGSGAFLAFQSGFGGKGIWIGLALGLAVVAVLMLLRWWRRERLGLTRPGHG